MAHKRKITKKYLNLISTVVFIIVVIIILLVYLIFFPERKTQSNQPQTFNSGAVCRDFKIHFVDVGQGDGIILELPDGKNMLIDAGTKSKVKDLTEYIDGLGITTFDYLIATHTHEDHIGGMKTVFDKYQINYVYRPHVYYYSEDGTSVFDVSFNTGNKGKSYSCKTNVYYDFLTSVKNEKCDWSFFNKDSDMTFIYTADGVDYTLNFDFLTPVKDVDNIAYNNLNDYSPLILIDYCGYKIMLTGDAEEKTEKEFLDYYIDKQELYDVDLLKVGHHGSETSSGEDFLAFIKPEVFVISCGKGNSNSHPREETLNKIAVYSDKIYRTDVQGSIILSVNKEGESDIITTITDFNESDIYIAP